MKRLTALAAALAALALLPALTGAPSPLWSRFTGGVVEHVAVSGDGLVAVATTANRVYVFDGGTGRLLWQRQVGVVEGAGLAWSPKGLLAVTVRHGLLVFNRDGGLAWEARWPSRSFPPGRGNLTEMGAGKAVSMAWLDGDTLAVLVDRECFVKTSERVENGKRVYTTSLTANATLEVYRGGRLLWYRIIDLTRGYWESGVVEYRAGRLLAASRRHLYLFKPSGDAVYSRTFGDGRVEDAALSPSGAAAVYLEDGGGQLLFLDPSGNVTASYGCRCYSMGFTGDGVLVALAGGEVLAFTGAGQQLWRMRIGAASNVDMLFTGPGNVFALRTWKTSVTRVERGSRKTFYAPIRVDLYSSSGGRIASIKGWYAALGPGGLLATWDTGVHVYRGSTLLWEKGFAGSARRLGRVGGHIAAVVYPLRGVAVLSPQGEVEANISPGLADVDVRASGGYLVVTGHDFKQAFVDVFDGQLKRVFQLRTGRRSGEDGEAELTIPLASASPSGLLAVFQSSPGGGAAVRVYNLSSGALIADVRVADTAPLDVQWTPTGKILYLARDRVGLLDPDGGKLFEEELEPSWSSPEACPLGGEIAVLVDGKASIYRATGEKVYQHKYYAGGIACGEGLLALYTYSTVTVLDPGGNVVYEHRLNSERDGRVSTVKVLGGKVVVGTDSGRLLVYGAGGGLIFTASLPAKVNDVEAVGDTLVVATDGGIYALKLQAKPVTLAITLPAEMTVKVDGKAYTGRRVKLSLPPGVHTVEAPPSYNDTRCLYRFKGWSDGAAEPSRRLDLQGNTSLQPIYAPAACLVSAETTYGRVEGTGWYSVGEKAVLRVSPTEVVLGEGVKAVFEGWSSGAKTAAVEVEVEGPVSLKALWKRYYRVTVSSSHGSVSGGGWYEEGSTATLRVDNTTVVEDGETYTFKGWRISGAIVSTQPTYTFTVDRPVSVEAVWQKTAPRAPSPQGGWTIPAAAAALAVAAGIALLAALKRRKTG